MKKQTISQRKMMVAVIVFIMGSTLMIGGSTNLKQDAWISMLIGSIISLPIVVMYARIIKLFPEKNIYEISSILFGKIFGKIIIILMTWYAFHLGALILRNFSEFIQITSKPETPQIIVMLSIVFLSAYLAKSGMETIGRWSLVVLPVVVTFVMGTILLASNDIVIENLFPLFNHTPKELISDSYLLFTFPYAEIVLFLAISDSLEKKASAYKVFIPGIFISAIILTFVIFRNVTLLGQEMMKLSLFPSFTATRIISLGKFLTKIEGFVMINFILLGVSKLSISLLAVTKGVASLFNVKDYKVITTPLSLLTVIFGITLYSNTIEMFDFIQIYQIYAIPFQIIIPLIIWVTAEIKMKKMNKNNVETALATT